MNEELPDIAGTISRSTALTEESGHALVDYARRLGIRSPERTQEAIEILVNVRALADAQRLLVHALDQMATEYARVIALLEGNT